LDLSLDPREEVLASIHHLMLKLGLKNSPLVLPWEEMVEIGVLDEALVESLEILRWR